MLEDDVLYHVGTLRQDIWVMPRYLASYNAYGVTSGVGVWCVPHVTTDSSPVNGRVVISFSSFLSSFFHR